MKRAISVLFALLLIPCLAQARPLEYNLHVLETPDNAEGKTRGAFSSAVGGTTYFGGTYWNATRSRWEALVDSVWTFDTGVGSDYDYSDPEVDPYKAGSGLHAHMEGWVGRDLTRPEDVPWARLLSTAADGGVGGDFAWKNGADICVGTAIGLEGSYSWWLGQSQGEVVNSITECWESGQGYGHNWTVFVERDFLASGNSGATLSFDAYVETETGFDFALAQIDTGDGEWFEVWSADGNLGVENVSVALTPGVTWPLSPQTVTIRLGVDSDQAFSDEDGLFATTCGAMAFDNVALTGDVTYGPQNFEAGPDGWAKSPPEPGIGDYSHLVHVDDLGPILSSCPCDLQDSVLAFFAPGADPPHPLDQENVAMSPWMDLEAAGVTGSPVKIFEFERYFEGSFANFVFLFFQAQYYPEPCPATGNALVSDWDEDNINAYVSYGCSGEGQTPWRLDYSDLIDPAAEQVRIAVGCLNLCSGWGACNGTNNFTPVFDNIRFGVAGVPDAPFIATSPWDTPYDSFPENGTLYPEAPGRLDCNQANDENRPFSSVGDTLVVGGKAQPWGPYAGMMVEVLFFVEPGPGTDLPALSAWESKHAFEGPINGKIWRVARMDTTEVNNAASNGRWMTAYHEDDPNGPPAGQDTLKDLTDLNPYGQQTRLQYDIFPDDLFTPGTHIGIAYRASYIDSTTGLSTGNYYMHPPGFLTYGDYFEMEVLPSSMAADSTWNCVLYVNHADSRGPGFEGSTRFVEEALDFTISGTSDNYDGTPYDIFDVEAAASNQGSFGRPIGSEYGCAATQILAYSHIIWYSRKLPSTAMKAPDADVIEAWLAFFDTEVNDNRFYGAGDGLADAMASSDDAGVNTLLSAYFGADLICNSYRAAGCNASGVADGENCIRLDPVGLGGGAHFNASTLPVAVTGNGCPELDDFDVLVPSSNALDDAQGNESYYNAATATATDFASVSHDVNALTGVRYRTVLDGVRIDSRRDNASCADGTLDANDQAVINDRMTQVGAWLGFTGSGVTCDNPYAGVDVKPEKPVFVTALKAARPNPFRGAGGLSLEFSLEAKGEARLEVFDVNGRLVLTVFDGEAEAGPNVVEWDGRGSGGAALASGVYFYRLVAGGEEHTRKQVVIRRGS